MANPEIKEHSESSFNSQEEAKKIFNLFIKADKPQKKSEVLKQLEAYSESQLQKIEDELKKLEKKEKAQIERLLLRIDIMQGEILEMVPEYPISKKIAVIINGDAYEKRHIGNVKRAIRVLQSKGFDHVYVAHGGNLKEFKNITQFRGTKDGVLDMFQALTPQLQKDALVFLYTTGHGMKEGNHSMVDLEGPNELTQQEIVQLLTPIKEKEGRIVAVFDQCYSGEMPNAIIQAGIEGIAASPGITDKETQCQFFAPEFFDALEKGRDSNKDGVTTFQEAFQAAMMIYRTNTNTSEHGALAKSTPELTLQSYDEVMASGKAVVVEIGATWCSACKNFEKEVHQVWGMIGDDVKFLTITDNINSEKDKLIKRMNIPNPSVFPTVYITTDGGKTFKLFHSRSRESIATELKEVAGIQVNNDALINTIRKQVPDKSNQEITAMVNFGITWIPIIKDMSTQEFQKFKEIASQYQSPILSHQDKARLYLRQITPQIYNQFYHGYSTDDCLVLEYQEKREIAQSLHSYDSRFPTIFKLKFHEMNQSSEHVNQFSERFTPNEVYSFVNIGVKAQTANQYNKRFNGKDILRFIEDKIPNETAMKYNKRFDGEDIANFVKVKISNETAMKYNKRFDGEDIANLVKVKISNETAMKYPERFSGFDIRLLSDINVTGPQAAQYNKWFSRDAIEIFISLQVPIEYANHFDVRFTAHDIATLKEKNIEMSYIDQYDQRFYGDNIVSFLNEQIPPSTANAYNFRFKARDIIAFQKAKISPQMANEYSERFTGGDVLILMKNKISSKIAQQYHERFNGHEISLFMENKITNKQIAAFDERFNGFEIVLFMKNKITNKQIKPFKNSFSGSDLLALIKADINPKVANLYHKRFSGENIAFLVKTLREMPFAKPEIANQYDERMHFNSIIDYITQNIHPDQANKYSNPTLQFTP